MTRLDICSVLVTLLHIAILRKETRFNGQMQSNNCMNRMKKMNEKKTRNKKTRNEKKYMMIFTRIMTVLTVEP